MRKSHGGEGEGAEIYARLHPGFPSPVSKQLEGFDTTSPRRGEVS